ncbi:hypothetical protein D6C77_04166 [Aureobasidium pullulans]|uniref:Peptidase S33 tripeptidyl aminopeptidase-like C-terminal domain-containing protein n=1 Tax=Aureobasidium pullulans TaxID=5580 RepID=A0A4S9BMG0_AURPU|nr:hypothetical protein D6D22_09269 [Aureobasidium pullulans]THW94765.1 hypothetical protein D6D15_01918 [Aureobasidium pullulans]THX28485.1 hypothetical protein D6D12_04785 [Aureobasidium pullulans]THX48470.1 hypothetical protein D6D11_06040 [Aureobasidium pullulans]THX70935.1 hypothetical protein D6D05_08428 [Aureobasidium pullulans]
MFFNKASALLLANTDLLHPFRQIPSNSQTPFLSDKPIFTWENLPANETLVYQDCFDGFKCAKLQVPMDWTAEEGSENRTVEIAVIKVPATVPVTDSRYGGAVILNPGGPGGSGVNLVLKEGKHTRTIISAGPDASNETAKHFDVISFDPRGVNNTRPIFHCFPDHIERLIFEKELNAYGVPGSSNTAFTNHWTRIRTLADSCSKRAVEAGIGEHMSTSSVARDIIEIVERHGEWREQEARRLFTILGQSEEDLPSHVRYQPGEELVQYWGFSYGTVLGATLADMYPGYVKRVILDGVVDSFDYYKGGWTTNLQDTDLEITKFAEYCWMGGSKNCALYHEDGPAFIVQRFADIMQELLDGPIGVPGTDEYSPDLATYSDLKMFFFTVAYRPLAKFHQLAEVMAQLEKGNGTALVQGRRQISPLLKQGLSAQCKEDGPYSDACDPANSDLAGQLVTVGILCTDSEDQTDTTKEEYREYLQDLMNQSKLMGDVWSRIRMPCTQWHARPLWRYEGKLNATTAHPILFIGNTVDNVTPIRNARKMSRGFPGSVVLQQDTEGHCSSSGVSFCTAKAVRNYFQTGELPKAGTICYPERLPLDGFSEEEEPALPKGETDEALWKAMVGVTK